ncbi:MAG: hypothetical protein JSV24_08190 [Bacteroidales bacterium]|nr:MAG: hypothetical protein JSV24_08190 [Bacteroidales bacterium]
MRINCMLVLLIPGIIFMVVSCTAGPNPVMDTLSAEGQTAGFLSGLWHGIIAPVTFFISLFTDNISLYEVHNNGGWYDFGFVLGAGILFGGSSRATKRKYKSG